MSKAPGVDDRGAVRLRLNVQAIRDEIGRTVADLAAKVDGLAAFQPDDALADRMQVVPAADVLALLAAVDLALARLQAHDHA